jgi:UrcA family protein
MNTVIHMHRMRNATIAGVVAIVGGTGFLSTSAVAEEISTQPEAVQGITIVAPYVVHREMVGKSNIGAPIEILSVSRRVSYADLDLTKVSDTAELKKRISDTAKDTCKYLYSMHPDFTFPPVTSNHRCAKTATREATALANGVIKASRS